MKPETKSPTRESAFPRMTVACALFVVTAGGIWAGWLVFRGPEKLEPESSSPSEPSGQGKDTSPPPEWRRRPEYAGSLACAKCHADQFDSFLKTSHSRSLTSVDSEQEPTEAVFDHPASGRRYRVTRRDGRLFHEESLLLDDGSEIALVSLPLSHRVGSGHFGRTYLTVDDGFFIESPVTWYEPRHEWGMSPGYDGPIHQSFTRVVPETCVTCHAGHVETRTGNDLRMQLVENSIGCERCHGPGKSHIERQEPAAVADAEIDLGIVNPLRLSRKLLEAVCEQCHLQGDIQVAGRGVRPTDYRAGLPLEEFRTEFRVRRPERELAIVGHFEQLRQSACYRSSDSLTCVTCHDPHRPVAAEDRSDHYRSACLKCHADQDCKLPLPARMQESKNDCTTCHMPSSATEVPHVAFTHHHIGVRPLKESDAAPEGGVGLMPLSDLNVLSSADQARTVALASAQLYGRLPREQAASLSGTRLGGETAERLGNVPAEATDAAVEVARAELALSRGDSMRAARAAKSALERAESGTDSAIRALAVLAMTEFHQNSFGEARELFRQLTKLRRNASDWHHLGLCENNCGDVGAAIRALQRAREIDPASVGTYEALAVIHHVRREFVDEQKRRDEISWLNRWRMRGGGQR